MSPTRPVDNGPGSSKAPKPSSSPGSARGAGTAGANQAGAAAGAESAGTRPSSPATVAASVTATKELMESAKSAVEEAGQARIEALKDQIRNGTFEVDTALLADRLLADSHSYELHLPKGQGEGA